MTDEFRKVTVEDLPDAPSPTRHKKEVDEAVGADAFGFNVFVADPGQKLPWGKHRHPDHEELLYVVDGRIRVETDGETFELDAGDALFVPRDEPQVAVAVGDDPARVVASGAPKSEDHTVLLEYCPECDAETDRDYEATDGGETYVLYCASCGAETDRLTAGPE